MSIDLGKLQKEIDEVLESATKEDMECDNPNCEDGIVGYDPYYKYPIYCQVCEKH